MKTTTVSAASASGGIIGALVVIIVWVASLFNVQVPAEVAAALMVCLTPILHVLAVRFGPSSPDGDSNANHPTAGPP